MYLYRSGNMPIFMLWLILLSSRGTNGRTIDGRTKDLVPSEVVYHSVYLIEYQLQIFGMSNIVQL